MPAKNRQLLLASFVMLALFGLFLFYLPRGTDYFYSFYPAVDEWVKKGDIFTTNQYNPPWMLIAVFPFYKLGFAGGQAGLMLFSLVVLFRLWGTFLPPQSAYAGPISLAILLFNLHLVDLFIRVQLDAFIGLGILLMYWGLRQDKAHLLGLGWFFASIRPSSLFLLGAYTLWLAYRRGYAGKALLIPVGVFGSSLLVFGPDWGQKWLEHWQNAPEIETWITTWLRVADYNKLPAAWAWGIMVLAGLISLWALYRFPISDERIKFAFLCSASLVVTPYALSYHYSIIMAVFIPVLVAWRLWLAFPLYALLLLPLLRVPFGADVAWIDLSLPVVAWLCLLALIRSDFNSPLAARNL